MADALRGSMDAAGYQNVVLGLIFLGYNFDAFEDKHAKLVAEQAQGADPEDPDEYRAESIFWVPPEARWAHLEAQAKQPTIGKLVDDAMAGIERDKPVLKGVLPKDYARPAHDRTRLGQLIDLISNIRVGDEKARAKDVLGRVYEYFLERFALAEGREGGESLTPHSPSRSVSHSRRHHGGAIPSPRPRGRRPPRLLSYAAPRNGVPAGGPRPAGRLGHGRGGREQGGSRPIGVRAA